MVPVQRIISRRASITSVDASGLRLRINLDRLYPEDEVTNTSREFAAGELIREQIYLRMGDEIPYRTRVEIGSIEERKTKAGEPLIAILATILVASDRYKAMVIGAGGQRIRQLNSDSRKELEHHFGKKVFLDCDVMVDKTILD